MYDVQSLFLYLKLNDVLMILSGHYLSTNILKTINLAKTANGQSMVFETEKSLHSAQ